MDVLSWFFQGGEGCRIGYRFRDAQVLKGAFPSGHEGSIFAKNQSNLPDITIKLPVADVALLLDRQTALQDQKTQRKPVRLNRTLR